MTNAVDKLKLTSQGGRRYNTRVIIIGAGLAGLSAGRTLYKNGFREFLILEAEPEPGGRVRTVQVGSELFDIGAQWLHGTNNKFYNFVKEKGLISSTVSHEGRGNFYRCNGEIIPRDILDEVKYTLSKISEKLRTCNLNELPMDSVGEFYLSEFVTYLDSCNDPSEIRKIKSELLDWHIRYLMIDNSCHDLFQLSSHSWQEFEGCEGPELLNVQTRFCSIIDQLVFSLPKECILLSTAVESIKWKQFAKNSKNICRIITKNGEIIHCEHVIVTCSVGYLKNNWNIFDPLIPDSVMKAFNIIGYDTVNKIFLKYDTAWWGETEGFQFVWNTEERLNKVTQRNMMWTSYLTGFDPLVNYNKCLLGWVGGKGAEYMENLSPETIGEHSTLLLREFTRNMKIPYPVRCISSSWFKNEYTKGAYSYLTIEKNRSKVDRSILQKPIYSIIEKSGIEHPSILFAGEAIHNASYSTTHGAFESGQSQANVLLEYFKLKTKEELT